SITRVNSGGFGQGGKLVKYKGDTNIYPVVIACTDNEPHATFTTADVGTMMGLVPGTSTTLTATLIDPTALGVNIVFTMINAVFENADSQAQHGQFATVTGKWDAYSSDGTTPPISFTGS
ncbi:MAG: hypothetical protein ACYDCP_09945, partial [Thermoplasmataceae archaeon]